MNLGSPDSASVKDVRKYLSEFLNDPRVIDLPSWKRFFLVNLIIIPFRAPKTAALYKHIWTDLGSPLITHSQNLTKLVADKLGSDYVVELCMRYRNPSIASALEKLKKQNVQKIIVVPLYPQYASSSTGTGLEMVLDEIKKWQVIPDLKIVSKFYDHPGYIEAFSKIASGYDLNKYDHVIFSFHGLPERHIKNCDSSGKCLASTNCCAQMDDSNIYCYRASSYETARKLAQALNITENNYTVSFQSRLGTDPWIKPYSDEVIAQKGKEGMKNILVFSPAFVADCLETIYEIGVEYNEIFVENGGEKIQLVESLNEHPLWVNALHDIIVN